MDFEAIKAFIRIGLTQKNGLVVGAVVAAVVVRFISR